MIITQTFQNAPVDCVESLVSSHLDGVKNALFYQKKIIATTLAFTLKTNNAVDSFVDYILAKAKPNDKGEVFASVSTNTENFPVVSNTIKIYSTGEETVCLIDYR